ncbi:branched-chain amino acid ABC transporter substrate-binding protein [Janibacter sp. Soil728]|uniref:ABC transporter substrate-binding protein n=1 Tax=Janibacter sp. Soil728 TaxID=1736393 RepID=UPI0006F4F376|nr:ABC transporter substrate-binding protein [Janibacter sp. Soil728]KRE38312.1 branched-chain amino acid ABC transporter substrate-binding protein [Janibacter sp. Soil728]
MTPASSSRMRRSFVLVASGSLVAALAACGGDGGGGSSEGETLVIGYSAGISGGSAEYGLNVQNGLQMAIDELNAEGVEIGGKNYTLKLESLDDQYQPSTTGTNAQRLVQKEGAKIVFVPHAGGIKAAQELNTTRDKFLLGAYSSDPEILASKNELTVMIPPSFTSYIDPFIDKVATKGTGSLGLLTTSSEFGQEWTKAATASWKEAGGKVLDNNNIDYGSVSDFAGPVSKTLAGKPDVILVGGPSQPTALIIEEARKQGYDGAFMIIDQAKFEELEEFTDPKNLNDSVGIAPLTEFDGTEDFITRYKEKFKSDKPVNADIALNYQSLPVFVEAMKSAGTVDDPQAIRDAMPEAVGNVDDKFKVAFAPDRISDSGHFVSDGLKAAYRNDKGKYESFPIDQPKD